MWCTLPLLWLLAAPPAPPAPPPPVRLVWFGATGGVSAHVGRNRAHQALADQLGFAVNRLAPRAEGPDVYAAGGRLLFRDGGLPVATLHRLLARLPEATHERVHGAWPVLVSPFEVVFEAPPEGVRPVALDLLMAANRLPGATRSTATLARFILDGDTVWALSLPEATGPWPTDPAAWEVRFAWEGDVQVRGEGRRLFNVGRPLHDGARRVAALQALVAAAPEQTLVVAAGDDLEAFSYLTAGARDRQRPVTWTAYQRLGLHGLAPGPAEAAFGLAGLAAESQRHRVPVLGANLTNAPFPGFALHAVGEAQVLLIGLSDPALSRSARQGFGDTPPGDPALAVRQARQAARKALGRAPDLVVGFGHLSAATRTQLVQAGVGLDLLLADFEDHGLTPDRVLTQLASEADRVLRARDRRPLSVVAAGRTRLGVAEVYFERSAEGLQISAVESRALPVTGDQPADPVTAHAVAEVRQAAYGAAERRLLPNLGPTIDGQPALRARFEADPLVLRSLRSREALPGRLTADLWRTLVANAVRADGGAEVAVLPPVPFPWALAGPVSRLQAAANLNVPDQLVVVALSADQIGKLARHPAAAELVITGLDLSDPLAPKVRGRTLDAREPYLVITTDTLRADPDLAPLLSGEPLAPTEPLRDAALRALAAQVDHPDQLARWMATDPGESRRWVFDVRDLSLGISDYRNARPAGGEAAYAGVRETRVTTRDNLAVNVRGDLYGIRQTPSVEWVNHLRAEFAQARYADGDGADAREETADAALAETELRFKALALGRAHDIDPYLTVQYATEFTPTEQVLDDGSLRDNPRKQRVDGSLGLVWRRDWVQLLRLGAVVGQDLAEPDPDPQVGAVAAAQLAVDFPLARWRLDAEARYFIPGVGQDTATELGAWLKARTSLDVPLFGGVGLGVFLDLYGYQGTSASTTEPGASLVSGLALRYDRLFKAARD